MNHPSIDRTEALDLAVKRFAEAWAHGDVATLQDCSRQPTLTMTPVVLARTGRLGSTTRPSAPDAPRRSSFEALRFASLAMLPS